MGVKIDLIEEIRLRIATAMESGGVLSSIKRLSVGAFEEARKNNDFPVINLSLLGGDEEADRPNRHFRDFMKIQVELICNKIDGNVNALYNTSNSSGPLYLLEALLNVLDKTVAGVPNNTFSGNAGYLRNYSYQIDHNSDLVIITIEVNAPTKSFALGSR